MAFKDGFYKVRFGTQLGQGSGVAHLADGKLYGGDSMMAYVGKYVVQGEKLSATVRVFTHTQQQGMVSVIGVGSATLNLTGQVDGSSIKLSGSAKEAPGATLTLELSLFE